MLYLRTVILSSGRVFFSVDAIKMVSFWIGMMFIRVLGMWRISPFLSLFFIPIAIPIPFPCLFFRFSFSASAFGLAAPFSTNCQFAHPQLCLCPVFFFSFPFLVQFRFIYSEIFSICRSFSCSRVAATLRSGFVSLHIFHFIDFSPL